MSLVPRALSFASLLLVAGCVSLPPGADARVRLIEAGRPLGAILVSPDAAPEERDAARFVAEWAERVTGVRIPVDEEVSGDERGLHVGRTVAARKAGVAPPGSRSGETFALTVRPDGVAVLIGGTPLATRQGAAELVRESLGVEFLSPGLRGADWGPKSEWSLPVGESRTSPSFAWRAITHGGTPEENEWAANNGLGRLPAINHALWSVFDATAWRDHPEFFPVVEGVRLGPAGRTGYEPQPNLAAPGAAAHAAGRAAEWFGKNPAEPAFSLCINDTMTWDDSPESVAAFGPEAWFRGRRIRTDYVFRFMNRVADELAPGPWRDRLLSAYAYFECEAPPSFRLRPAVFPILTADRSEWRDPAFAEEDRRLIGAWADAGCATFGVYDYHYGRDMAVPRLFYRAEAESIRFAASRGASLFFAEMNPEWGVDAAKAWLAARLTRRADTDPEAATAEWFSRAYGPAAEVMRRFHALAESRWENRDQPPRWIRFYREESSVELFPKPVREEMSRLMAEARRLASQPKDDRGWRVRARVIEAALSWSRYAAFADFYDAKRRLAALPAATDAVEVARIGEAYEACVRARLAWSEACARAGAAPWNCGKPFPTDHFFESSFAGLAALKCDGLAGSGLPAAWVRVFAESAESEVSVRESFEPGEFADFSGVPALRRPVSPRAPWASRVAPGEHVRFGPDVSAHLFGRASLLVAGCEQALLARRLRAGRGDVLGVVVAYAGRITPGEHVAVTLRFIDAAGRRLGRISRCTAYPGGGDEWRELAVVGEAPVDAAFAEIGIFVSGQDAGDTVRFDDLRVRRLPASR